MADKLDDIIAELALANRILANEGVLDAFGHVSARHPADPGRYLLPRARSPGLVEPADILEFTLDSEPVKPPTVHLYAERVIHGCIYQARPDVMAICHHHAPAIMPFAIAGKPSRWTAVVEGLQPHFHLGGESLKRPPAGFDREHPLIEELKRKDFIAISNLSEDAVLASGFLDAYLERCAAAGDFMRFLCDSARVEY